MNLILLRKELTALRLCAMLVIALSIFEVIYVMATNFPDRQSGFNAEATNVAVSTLFFGLIIGFSALSQERTQQTQSFLDGLPISRVVVFLHKTLAAMLIMAFTLLVPTILELLLAWLSQTSLSTPLPLVEVATVSSLRLLLGITVVAVAMLLSYTQQWFPLMAGLALWAVVWFRASGSPWVAWLHSSDLISPSSSAGEMLLPWKPIAGHAALAAIGLLGAGLGFQWRDGRISRWIERLAEWRFSAWLTGFSRLLAVGVWLFAIQQMAKREDREPPQPPEATAAGESKPGKNYKVKATSEVVGFATHQTRHYEVIFRESQRQKVQPLFAGMDRMHDQVADFFQQPPVTGARIVVDVASLVSNHAAGQTNWTKIRLPLALSKDADDFRQTLRHETAHVYIEQLSQGHAMGHFNAMRAFHEGVATAAELAGNDQISQIERQRMERWAAATDSRGRVPLTLLCDDDALTEKRETFIVYPLGYVFAMSLIDTGGPALPRRLLEVLNESPPAPGSDHNEFWQQLLQKCGTSFDHVIAAYSERLDQLKKREQTFISRLPRLTGKVTVEGEDIVIRVVEDLMTPIPAKLACMVEQDLGMIQMPQPVLMEKDGTFHIRRASHSGSKVRYLLGWDIKDTGRPIFEPWAEAILK